MIKRNIEGELINLANQYPVVTITGPRQSGKTTLARMSFPGYKYCNLELPDVRHLAENDPRALFSSYPPPVILDEIQRVPGLLSYIQAFADEIGQHGQFILTGSHQLLLLESITQSLAGRTSLLTLLPLSIHELKAAGIVLTRDEQIFRGFFPRLYKDNLEPSRFYRNYYQTYVERDIRRMINIKNIGLFEKFLYILAGRIGQLLNLHSMANEVGVSSTTLNEWISVLEASFIIFRLKPYYENFGKRAIKSSKLYFSDTGLACYLSGLSEVNQVGRDPLLGNLFENLVILEAFKARLNRGMDPNLFFFRDNNQNEIDLVYMRGRSLIPIEIKAALTYHESLHEKIPYFHAISGSEKGYLIYGGDMEIRGEKIEVLNFMNTWKLFDPE